MKFQRTRFFIRYYLRKHLLGNVSAQDVFLKRLYRLQRAVPGSVEATDAREIVYRIEQVNGRPLSLFIRGGASSDIQVMHQVFAAQEYMPLVNLVFTNNQQSQIRRVIDAGGNVGYTTLLLKSFFPAASVVLIEPDTGNLEQVQKNINANNITECMIVHGGIWPADTWLEIKNGKEGSEWGFVVAESPQPTDLRGYSFETILARANFETIDILKIDVEGTEALLFEHEAVISDVLRITRFLAIEIHDHTGARGTICETLERNGFTYFNAGELTIATNTAFLNTST